MRWQWILVLVLLVVLLSGGAAVLELMVTNGSRVGPQTTVGKDGIIRVRPSQLAAAAGLDDDTYSLARCFSSEHGSEGNDYLIAIGWAVRNKAAERGVSITELLTAGAGSAGDGYYGEQKAAAGTKYASTRSDPHDRHVQVASAVVHGLVPDPTGGATHFFSPKAQDWLAEKAETDPAYAKYRGKDAEFIFRSWSAPGGLYAQGALSVVPAGIDPRVLVLWRPA